MEIGQKDENMQSKNRIFKMTFDLPSLALLRCFGDRLAVDESVVAKIESIEVITMATTTTSSRQRHKHHH